MSLKSLEVNPQQTAFYIGDILGNEDFSKNLDLTILEKRKASFEWFTISASFGNVKAYYEMSMMLREELSKIIFCGTFVWKGEDGVGKVTKIKDLDTLWSQDDNFISKAYKRVFESEEEEDEGETQDLLYSVYHNQKHKDISKFIDLY